MEVELSGSVRILGTNAFQRCLALKELVLPEGLEIIGSKSFNCSINLEKITLPKSLTVIDMKAFDDVTGLKTVVYNGTEAQASLIVISEQAQGNKNLLNAEWIYQEIPADAGTLYDDVTDGIWYEEAINYLTGGDLYAAREKTLIQEKCLECSECPQKHLCTTSNTGRNIQRWEQEELLEKVKESTLENNDIYKQRRSIVEHPFGTVKRHFGYSYFLRRRIENVDAEAASMFIAYNLKRLFSMFSIEELIKIG